MALSERITVVLFAAAVTRQGYRVVLSSEARSTITTCAAVEQTWLTGTREFTIELMIFASDT